MLADNPYYPFSLYMFSKFYAEVTPCEEELIAANNVAWLCASFNGSQELFEERWSAFMSVQPLGVQFKSISIWGEVGFEGLEKSFYGKVYEVEEGRLVGGYDALQTGRELRIGFAPQVQVEGGGLEPLLKTLPPALAITNIRKISAYDYGTAPIIADEGLSFSIEGCGDCAGKIYSFRRLEDLKTLESYYQSYLKGQEDDYIFSGDRLLLQLSGLSRELAEQYQEALLGMARAASAKP
ncbi:MAG: hypothetical protein R2880_13380 [Deinococcales bacterium]